jgi:hypothetical protein
LALRFGSGAEALAGFATMQKYVVLATVGWYLIFSVRMVCTTELPTERSRTLDYSAEEYERWLRQANWRVRRPT